MGTCDCAITVSRLSETMDLLPSLTQSTHSSEEVTWVDGAEDGEDYPTDEALAAVALFEDYPEYLLTFAAGCCMLFMLLGIPGNLITIIALARCKKVQFIYVSMNVCNLLLSDLSSPSECSYLYLFK